LFHLLKSIDDDISVVCGRALELLTRHEPNDQQTSPYWPIMLDNGLIHTLIHVLTESKNDDLLTSVYLLLLNSAKECSRVKQELLTIKNAFNSILKHTRSKNQHVLILLGRLLACLTEDQSLIQPMVEHGLIESLMFLIDKERSPHIIWSYFDCLADVVSFSTDNQLKLANASTFVSLIINHYLEEFDLCLSLSVLRFLCKLAHRNESIQNLLAQNGACEHILGALSASSKELQHVAIEAIQAVSENNSQVQRMMLRENAVEQLLTLLEKTSLSSLQTAIVCTLWALCGNSSTRKRDVATRMGVKKLISFYGIKRDEHLCAVTDALGELAKRAASEKMNVQEEIQRAQGIPPLIRLLKSDSEALVLSALKTLQLLACAPGFVANRKNQEKIVQDDGAISIVTLMMHAKTETIQVEAAQTLACIALCMCA
jgi:DNA-binding FrmR family transcriptional regulator